MDSSGFVSEQNYPQTYRQDIVSKICTGVENGESISLIGVKDNCKINTLRFICTRPDIQKLYLGSKVQNFRWIFINVDEITEISLSGFYHLIGANLAKHFPRQVGDWHYLSNQAQMSPAMLIKAVEADIQEIISNSHQTLVFAFNNFDLVRKLDLEIIYHHLVAIRQSAPLPVQYIFSGTRPFTSPHFLFQKIVWMTPFSGIDATELVSRHESGYHINLTQKQRDEIVSLSGGHAGTIKFLVQNLASSAKTNPAENLDFQCHRILSQFTDLEKAKLKANHADSLLQNLGIQVRIKENKVQIFSSLLKNYLDRNTLFVPTLCYDGELDEIYHLGYGLKKTLANKEFRILKLLITNPGKVLSREEIMDTIWDAETVPSDWALDKQISRLRQKIGKENLCVRRGQGIYLKCS